MHSPRRTLLGEYFPRIPQLAVFAMLAVPALACRSDAAETRGTEAPPATSASATAVMEPEADSLGLELVLPPRARAGEPVPITLRVENRTQRPLDLYLRGRTVTFDVIVARPSGAVVWRRLEDEIIPAIIHLRTLAPAERLEREAQWNQRTKDGTLVEAGEYTARGLLLVESDPLETPSVPLRIVER